MKKLFLTAGFIVFAYVCNAQVNTNPSIKKDTLKVDSAQVDKINKMPMDTTHLEKSTGRDVLDTLHRRTGDDEDPKRNNQPKK